MNPIIGKLAL